MLFHPIVLAHAGHQSYTSKEMISISKLRFLKSVKRNFFSSYSDGLITILISLTLLIVLIKTLSWILFSAKWTVVTANIAVYVFGFYPKEELWRPILWLISLFILIIISILNIRSKKINKIIKYLWFAQIPLSLFLLAGGLFLSPVYTRSWGGIVLTLILTFISAIISLPFGILLALGRQSKTNFIRKISGTYVDLMRSFPLITVLFFGQLLIPLFLPMEFEINRVIRAIMAFSLFTASYIAEDIRGGLQSISNSQIEAAMVLGFSQTQTIKLIVLPQALRTALPAMTNQFIGLMQNTSLMAILGLVELMGVGRSILANPNFIGRYLEVYIWLAFVYWLLCTILALISRSLESKLNLNSITK